MSRHPLFRHYPLTGVAETSIGTLSKPYHVYNGHGLLIGGTADFDRINTLLQNETVTPLPTQAGRALMAIWVCDFTRASLDPHTELQIAFLVSTGSATAVSNQPLGLLHALVTNPDAAMFCHGLWNNREKPLVYNREVLGLPAELATSKIERGNGRKSFSFTDANEQPICRGSVAEAGSTALGVAFGMLRLFGLRRMLQMAREPMLSARVINPIGELLPRNAAATTYLASETPVVQTFQTGSDELELLQEPYTSLGFRPLFLEHFAPFRFVYLMPE